MFQPGGRGHRRRPQGDVRLPRQGRSPHRAAARGHRVGRAGLRRAPPAHAVEGLVRRAELPLRARPGRPLPPAPPAGRRGLGSADPDLDVEVIGPARTTSTGARAAPGRPASSTRSARPPTAPHYIDAAARRSSSGASPSSTPTTRRRSRRHPMRVLDSKRPADAGGRRPTRRCCSTTCRPRPPPTSTGCSAGSTPLGIGFRIEPRLVRGLDYYTHTAFEFQSAALGGGPEHHRRRRSLRRPGRVARRAADAGHRLRHGHRADPVDLRRRGRVPVPGAAASTSSWSTSPAARPHATSRFELRRAGIAADRAFDGRGR